MNELSYERKAELKRLIASGASIRTITDVMRCSRQTVRRYLRLWQFSPVCGCGRPAGHQGWCFVRLDFSPARRGFLEDRWQKRKDSSLAATVDEAMTAAHALGHDVTRFVWCSAQAASMAYAACRICGKTVRVFGGGSQWERYLDWKQYEGNAVTDRCYTPAQVAANKAAQKEKRAWHDGKRTLVALRRALRDPSSWPNEASTPARSSPQ